MTSLFWNRIAKIALFATAFNTQECPTWALSTGSGVVRVDLQKQLVQRSSLASSGDDDDIMLSDAQSEPTYAQLRNEAYYSSTSLSDQMLSTITESESEKSTSKSSTKTTQSSKATNLSPKKEENVQTAVQVTTGTKTSQLMSDSADPQDDVGTDMQLQVPLVSKNDAVYMGTVYMGTPVSQPAIVVFDTGSEYLTITSALCDDSTAGNYHFKKWDSVQKSFVQREPPKSRCKTMSYDMHKSDSQRVLSKASSKLTYGSARIQAFIWEDYTCIKPLPEGVTKENLGDELKKNKCALFQFLALYKAQGLGKNSDGILGLSPHKETKKKKLHYLWSLKNSGIIDHAIVSFSVTSKDMPDAPYALFGGYNSSQIVGGASGLKSFKNFDNWLGTWALEGQGTYYGEKTMQEPSKDPAYPAIIDTGSSQFSIPPAVFENLKKEWAAALPKLDCESDSTFCQVSESCESVAPKLKPIGFQFSDYVFEMKPELYLFVASSDICYFVVHECKLPGKNADLFLVGDVFLRHFYSVYDFDRDQVGLGINTHSEGKVLIYKPGQRPSASDQSMAQESENTNTKNSEVQEVWSEATNDPDLDIAAADVEDQEDVMIKSKLRIVQDQKSSNGAASKSK